MINEFFFMNMLVNSNKSCTFAVRFRGGNGLLEVRKRNGKEGSSLKRLKPR
jgi:hypothetical protein